MKELEVSKVLPVINANFEEVKESLSQNLKKYKGIVVTEETLQDCKKTQQDLNKVEKGIEDFRKSVKRDMEAPIKEFEAKCKELTALIGEVKKPIREGIVLYDTKRKEEKKKQAEEIIKECILNLALSEKYSSQLTVLDKYTNLSASKKSVVEDVEARGQALKQQQDAEEKVSASIDLKPQKTVPVNQEEKLYFYDLRVIANKENMLKLHELIKSEGFNFEVKNQGVVNK